MSFKIGERVEILSSVASYHVGKLGTIVAIDTTLAEELPSPEILLDDGMTVFGYEVWWEPATTEEDEPA